MVDFIRKNKVLSGLLLFAVAAVYVFFPVLGKYAALHSPDSMPFFSYGYRTAYFANVLNGAVFTAHTLYWLLLHPLYAHEITYIIDSLFLTLAGVYYLRGRNVHPLAAWCGGLALGLSGYTFTLFCAGHRGYFHMMSSVIWSFGVLDRGFRTQRLFYFAAFGLLCAWGVTYQPDVFVLIGAVAGLYALWLTAQAPESFARTALRVWPRFAVTLAFLGVAGFGSIRHTLTVRMAERKAQIASVQKPAEAGEATDQKQSAADKARHGRDQWLFATNWSLPPEDVLEFMIPGIFGNESFHGANPYWGRLGRPDASVFQKGRMMPNYRQHTVYFGVVAFVFSLFAVICRIRSRKEPEPTDNAEADVLRDVPFWGAVWLATLILAMGRYTPLYRLFYAIPLMDLIRAPVKFLHLTEIASAFLCGIGVHLLIAAHGDARKRKMLFLRVSGGVAAVVGVTALIFLAGQSSIIAHVKSLGAIQNPDAVCAYAFQNIGRSLFFLVAAAGASWLVLSSNAKRTGMVLVLFPLLMVVDQALVARRYVKAMDVRPLYAENAVVKAIKGDAGGGLPRVLNYAPRPQQGEDWFRRSLSFNGIVGLEPTPADAGKPYAQLFESLQNNPVRLWQVLNARYLILPYKSAGQLVQTGMAKPLLAFDLGPGIIRESSQPGENTLALLALAQAENKPRIYTEWRGGLTAAEQIAQLAESKLVVSDAVRTESDSGPGVASLEVLFEQPIPAAYSIGVKATTPSEALLVFHHRHDERYEILVDGSVAENCTADGNWMAVKLPAGEHEVVLQRQKAPLRFFIALSLILFLAGWGIFGIVAER